MRVIFMGTPDFSVPVLEALVAAGHEIAAVYCQPPRPAGRGKKDRPTPVHARAEALGLEVRHPERLRSAEEQERFAALGADVAERFDGRLPYLLKVLAIAKPRKERLSVELPLVLETAPFSHLNKPRSRCLLMRPTNFTCGFT